MFFAFVVATAACKAAEPAATIDQLMAICLAHPGFQPSSIDFYDPNRIRGWEKEFYERAKSLHLAGREPMNLLLEMRASAAPEEIRCVDGILNTWPG